MKKVSFLFVLTSVLLSAVLFAAPHHGPEVITIDKIQEKKPPVTFSHWKHQERVSDDCSVCHHTRKADELPKACSECHGKVEGAPDFKKAVHTTCRECHKKEAALGKNAPTKCSGCHVKE